MEKADWDKAGYGAQTVSKPEDGIRFGLDIGHTNRDIHQRFSELSCWKFKSSKNNMQQKVYSAVPKKFVTF